VSTVSLPSHAPNEALEATGHSAGFFLSSWLGGAVARASAWAFGSSFTTSRRKRQVLSQQEQGQLKRRAPEMDERYNVPGACGPVAPLFLEYVSSLGAAGWT